MARRINRRTAAHKPAEQTAPTSERVAKPLFGGKGDHDNNGTVGGSAPPIDQGAVDTAAHSITPPKGEPSLHELNMRAREIDREHAERRLKARRAAKEAADKELGGVAVFHKSKRFQKPLRPPVTAPVKDEAKA